MKTTLEKVVSINFFSPLEASFHLSYCTTFSDQVYNLRFHCSPCFRSLPVIYFYFSALPGSKNQGLYILFVDFRPGCVVKREHTHTHTHIHTEICALYIRLAAPRRRPRPFGALLLLRSSYSPYGTDCPFGAMLLRSG